jgi:hypothetical protein
MEKIDDKAPPSYGGAADVYPADAEYDSGYTHGVKPVVYDPSLESRWTRLGLNLESLKRAPGTTG